MFGSKKVMAISPATTNNDVVIQFSDSEKITKSTCIKVPMGYKAIAYIDEKPEFRVEACPEKNIVEEYGKDYLDKKIKVAFINAKGIQQMTWGLGNVQVNNERLKEAYRAGANGKYVVEISDFAKLINAFGMGDNITAEKIREKTLSVVKAVGTEVLSKCFAYTNTSVFEIDTKLSEIRDNIIKGLQNEKVLTDLGIKLKSLTIDGIHINDEDMDVIREHINENN